MMNLGAPHLSKEFFNFTRALGEAKSKQEEERLVLAEIERLKRHLHAKSSSKGQLREYLVRAIYVDMLGFDSEFAHIHAINLAQHKDISCKRAGYLACSLLLSPSSSLMLLLINTIQKDLQSYNFLERTCALKCVCSLLNREMLPIVLPLVLQSLQDAHEHVRKVALSAIVKIYEFDHDAIDNVNGIIERGICDASPAVMGNALNLLLTVLESQPRAFRHLAPSLASILTQVCEGRLPSSFDYHGVAAPWIQMSIVRIFGKLGAGDSQCCEYIHEPLSRVLQLANCHSNLIASALVHECIHTIANITAKESIVKMASEHVSALLNSSSLNLRFAGICGLVVLVPINSAIAMDNQATIVACLDDADATIRRKTLELLVNMTNFKNVSTVVNCLLQQLKANRGTCSSFDDDALQNINLARNVLVLADKYAPNIHWYIATMIQVIYALTRLESCGDLEEQVLSNVIGVIRENLSSPPGNDFRDEMWAKGVELLSGGHGGCVLEEGGLPLESLRSQGLPSTSLRSQGLLQTSLRSQGGALITPKGSGGAQGARESAEDATAGEAPLQPATTPKPEEQNHDTKARITENDPGASGDSSTVPSAPGVQGHTFASPEVSRESGAACHSTKASADAPLAPPILVKLASWILGELAFEVAKENFNDELRLLELHLQRWTSGPVAGWLITVVQRLLIANKFEASDSLVKLLRSLCYSECTTTFQKSRETLAMLQVHPQVLLVALGGISACNNSPTCFDLSKTFIPQYVELCLKQGAKGYSRPVVKVQEQVEVVHAQQEPALKYEPYVRDLAPEGLFKAPPEPSRVTQEVSKDSEGEGETTLKVQGVKKVWGPSGYPKPDEEEEEKEEDDDDGNDDAYANNNVKDHMRQNIEIDQENRGPGNSPQQHNSPTRMHKQMWGSSGLTLESHRDEAASQLTSQQRLMARALFQGLDDDKDPNTH